MLERLVEIANTNPDDRQRVRSAGFELEELILGGTSQESVLEPDTLERLQRVYERFEIDLEYDFARKVIDGEATIEQYPLYQRFQRLVQAEVDLANITDKDRVLFIGSGPFPISAILLSQITSARVDCFDHSREAVSTSEMVIEKLGLSDRIRILNAGGDTQKIYGYNVIMVAILTQPKSEILYNAQFSVPERTRIICRTSEGTRQVFYKPTNPATYEFLGRYQLVGKHDAGIDDTISSLFFRISGHSENR